MKIQGRKKDLAAMVLIWELVWVQTLEGRGSERGAPARPFLSARRHCKTGRRHCNFITNTSSIWKQWNKQTSKMLKGMFNPIRTRRYSWIFLWLETAASRRRTPAFPPAFPSSPSLSFSSCTLDSMEHVKTHGSSQRYHGCSPAVLWLSSFPP